MPQSWHRSEANVAASSCVPSPRPDACGSRQIVASTERRQALRSIHLEAQAYPTTIDLAP
jgi:hypothetical protein